MEIFSAMEIALARVSTRVNSRGKIESGRGPLVITVRAAEEAGQTGAGEVAACSLMRARKSEMPETPLAGRRCLQVIDTSDR